MCILENMVILKKNKSKLKRKKKKEKINILTGNQMRKSLSKISESE